jgi:hypothetical protein
VLVDENDGEELDEFSLNIEDAATINARSIKDPQFDQ